MNTKFSKIVSTLAFGAAVALGSSAALASNTVDIPLQGELAKECNLNANLNGPFDDLDMTSTAVQGDESLGVTCNYGGTATVTFVSQNGGYMESGANQVGYNFRVSNGTLLDQHLTVPGVVNNWPAVANAVQTRNLQVQLHSAATQAGIYTDVVTATVTPN